MNNIKYIKLRKVLFNGQGISEFKRIIELKDNSPVNPKEIKDLTNEEKSLIGKSIEEREETDYYLKNKKGDIIGIIISTPIE